MTTPLTEHFALEELSCTQQRGLDNTPPPTVVAALRETAVRMEEVRRLLGDRVITVSSGYRSPAVNRAVGGAERSAHLSGRAVDFNCYGFGTALEICRAIAASAVAFDQLIQEGTWVHISFAPAMRRQVLTRRGRGYAPGLPS
jgi:zinc D-Ala-D-Ala carboxypeptidase